MDTKAWPRFLLKGYKGTTGFNDLNMSSLGLTPVESERLVNRLKNTNLEKFNTMCKMHLSFLLDLPGSSLEEFLGESDYVICNETKTKRNFPHFGKKKNKGERGIEHGVFGSPLTHESIERILPLLEYLGRPESLGHEGLFRKSGQLARQKVIREKVNNYEDMGLDKGAYTADDCACLLKCFLGELPEPLLPEKHHQAYCQVPDMVKDSTPSNLKHQCRSKQLQTIQLLIQLLPSPNAALLQCILNLLNRVASVASNKMTAETLGTLFAPRIIVAKKVSADELQASSSNIAKAVAFMIENAVEIFKVPDALVRDISRYWDDMDEANSENRPGSSCDEHIDVTRVRYRKRQDPSDVVNTTLTFVDRQASLQAAATIDTQIALAELYAHVSAMPDSTKKRKLMKQFNKANGMGTPVRPTSSKKHSRSKSLGDSIKKMVGRNHKRRGSGQSGNMDTENQCTRMVEIGSSHSSPQLNSCMHTPVIKKVGRDHSTPSLIGTPVLRRFKSQLQSPILPSSPKVHIVDMKHEASVETCRRKRKLDESPLTPGISPFSPSPVRNHCSPLCVDENSNKRVEHLRHLRARFAARQKSPHAHVCITPEGRFEKPTAFVSPISRSVQKASKLMQAQMMTPGSRKPMAVIQTP